MCQKNSHGADLLKDLEHSELLSSRATVSQLERKLVMTIRSEKEPEGY